MAKFEVCREFDALSGGDVAISNKDHVSYRTSREDSTANELTDEVDG